jgi:hypothetical protein
VKKHSTRATVLCFGRHENKTVTAIRMWPNIRVMGARGYLWEGERGEYKESGVLGGRGACWRAMEGYRMKATVEGKTSLITKQSI